MTGVVIPIFNRPKYLRQCLDSLKKLTTKPDIYILVDDCSIDPETHQLTWEFTASERNVHLIKSRQNLGVRASLASGIEVAFQCGCDFVINLDSDMIVKPHFIRVMADLKKRYPANIVSGINCMMRQKTGEERNPLLYEHEDHYLKKYVAGQCLGFYAEQYAKFIKPALKINGNWDHNASIACDHQGLAMIVCKPSVAQHIGMESSMGHNGYGELPDRAEDFDEKINLPTVTLFGIDANNPAGLIRAAEACQQRIKFADVKIITDRLFPGPNREVGRKNYSEFMIKHLADHFKTSHVLTIHDDGFVQNPDAWNNDWLQWDFIGGTWDWYNEYLVGNGGFSLRSLKLCQVLASDPEINDFHPEDDKICRKYRPYLEKKYGIRFAPVEVAKKFSIEGYGLKPEFNVYNGEFGFHGRTVKNLLIKI